VKYELQSKRARLIASLPVAEKARDPVVLLADDILHKAITMQASDIHLEPTFLRMRIRYRIDGILYDQDPISKEEADLVLSRLKILSSLNIAQRRLPQDGKLMIDFVPDDFLKKRLIDLRISTFPTVCGEKMVIRILDRHWQRISLDLLGCSEFVLRHINNLIERPYGLFLVTGPTGSGKTTTLYAILSKLNKKEKNIVTMEDPVEYYIEGIAQSEVNKDIKFTFDCGLPFLLRQDPDIIMIGEVRDKATAQISVESALTGHFVLSSLHTNDAVGAISRLTEMGIEPFLITGALSGVLAQRLVRLLCPHCKSKKVLNDYEKEAIQKYGIELETSYKSVGCRKCFDLGYKGRTGVFELLVVDDTVSSLIMEKVSPAAMRRYLLERGMILMQADGIEKVIQGSISLQEFLRVIP
jgi:type II secretory ATPase GspE/PulE/Tfp pilus assembly ATPase PilB-like protein